MQALATRACAATAALRRCRRRAHRALLAPPGGGVRVPAAQMKLLPCARLQGEFRSCGSVPAGGVLAARAGSFTGEKAKARHNVPGLGDATANQEVVSPLIAVVCAVDLNVSPFKVPAHSIALAGAKVKQKSCT